MGPLFRAHSKPTLPRLEEAPICEVRHEGAGERREKIHRVLADVPLILQ